MGGDESLSPAREAFTERFALLLAQAGDPPLRRVAEWASTTESIDDRGRPITVPVQRISDWRRGRNVPVAFASLVAVLKPVIIRARRTTPEPPISGLYDLRTWETWWSNAATSPRVAVEDAAPTATRVDDNGVPPYRGLAPFRQEDASWFFGRDRSTTTLMARLADAMRSGGIVVITGASGVGKSSLLHAGLTKALMPHLSGWSGVVDWLVKTVTPSATPAEELLRRVPELSTIASTDEDGDGFDEAVRRALVEHARSRGGDASRMILVVDQFEEVFTQCHEPDQVRRFIRILQAASSSTSTAHPAAALVVIGVRADFYERCLDHPALADALQARSMALGPMTLSELREAIAQPAKKAGVKIEPGLVDVMLRDLGADVGTGRDTSYTAGALPLLSHALFATWQHRNNGGLTLSGYQAAGGIHGAIAATAERAWAELSTVEQAVARTMLLRLVHLGLSEAATRHRSTRQELLEASGDLHAAETALDALAKARLITLDADSVEITHEALIKAWPRLRRWIDEERTGVLLRQRLEEDSREWVHHECDASLLYRGARLENAVHYLESTPLTRTAREFLAASARHRRRRTWRSRAALAVLTVLTIIASSTAFIAFDQRNDAKFSQLLAEADRLAGIDASLSAQLTLLAHRVRPNDAEVRTRLLATQNTPLSTRLVGHTGAVYQTSFSPDGRLLATASYDNTVRLWDVHDGTPVGEPLTGHRSWVTSAVFSPDGRTLATAADDATIILRDVADPQHPTTLGTPLDSDGGTVYQLVFSPDGHLLATAQEDGTVRLWDVRDRSAPFPLDNPLTSGTQQVRTVAFSPDGSLLAAGGDDGTTRLWDLSDPTRAAHSVPAHSGTVHSVAFSPDGTLLATGGEDKVIRLWSARDGLATVGQPLIGHSSSVWQIAFSPDGHQLASAASDSTARLWNLSDPTRASQLGRPLTGHTSGLSAVAFSPDGRTLATGSNDNNARLWSLPTTTLVGHSDAVNALRFTVDGHTLASGSADGTARLWGTTDPAHPHPAGVPITGHSSYINYLAITPDGHTLATASGDRTTRLWDVTDPDRPEQAGPPLPGDIRYRGPVAFSPDGHLLASGHDDHSNRLWDITAPASPQPVGTPLGGHTGYVNGIAFRPDGHLLATASSDKTVRLWTTTGSPIGAPLTGHTGDVRSVAFSPDGTLLATAADDRTVRLWNVSLPEHPTPIGSPITGSQEFVGSVAFSPDGSTLAAGSGDGTARLWDVSDPAHPVPLGGPLTTDSDTWLEVVFDPRGRYLATGSGDGVTRLWDLDLDHDHATDRICTTTRAILDTEQWARHIPQYDYTPPCP